MSRFGLSERTAIEAGIYRRASFAQIAKEIGTTARSVSEEIRRNRTLSPAAKFNGKDCSLLQNARDNVFAEIVSADMSVYFAEKLTVEQFAPDMLLFPANALTRLRMFAMFASFEEAAPAIAPTMLPHRLMLLL